MRGSALLPPLGAGLLPVGGPLGPKLLGGRLALGQLLDAGDRQQLGHGLGRLRALGQPLPRLVGVDLDAGRLVVGVVDADVLDEPAVARAVRVGNDHSVVGRLLHAHAHQADLDCHRLSVLLLRGGAPVAVYLERPSLRRRLGFMPASCFIILRASSNCLTTEFTCCVVVPEPRAMRARREPLRILGLWRSPGVIERMIASTLATSRSSTSMSFRSRLIPGSIPSTWFSGPIFLTCWSCCRKSSSVNEASRSLRSICSASWRSTSSSARSISVSTSPMPRMRPARRSGWNGSKSPSFSPVVANLIGTPVTARTERAAPPRASPSSLERITPVTSMPCLKATAVCTASWPVIASTTSRTSAGATWCWSARPGGGLGHPPGVDRQPPGRVDDHHVAPA